jgi:hypothetical protein
VDAVPLRLAADVHTGCACQEYTGPRRRHVGTSIGLWSDVECVDLDLMPSFNFELSAHLRSLLANGQLRLRTVGRPGGLADE